MCLAVPMRLIDKTRNECGIVEIGGVQYEVDLSLIDEVDIADFVIVHAGFAIERLEEREARLRLELFEKMARIQRRKTGRETRLVEPPKTTGTHDEIY